MLHREKNVRRIAKRPDRDAADFLAAICVATVGYWFLSPDALSLADAGGSWAVGPLQRGIERVAPA